MTEVKLVSFCLTCLKLALFCLTWILGGGTTSHYLTQCWPRSISSYDVTRPQWVKFCFPYGNVSQTVDSYSKPAWLYLCQFPYYQYPLYMVPYYNINHWGSPLVWQGHPERSGYCHDMNTIINSLQPVCVYIDIYFTIYVGVCMTVLSHIWFSWCRQCNAKPLCEMIIIW